MPSQQLDRIHIKLYEEILTGKFNPTNIRYSNPEVLKQLVEEANKVKLAVLSTNDDPNNIIETIDYKLLGYLSHNDFDLEVQIVSSLKKELYIKPVKVYELKEMIDLPYYNSFKCTAFLELLGDEFERIKIRAVRMAENGDDEKLIRAYAKKHLLKAKKLFYDARNKLREVQQTGNPEDVYIFFAHNLFMVRTIIFFQKMFKLYLNAEPDSEEKLIAEVLKELSLKKLCSLFPCERSSYCNYVKKSFIEKSGHSKNTVNESKTIYENGNNQKKSKANITGITDGTVTENPAIADIDFFGKKSMQTAHEKWQYAPMRWYGQINALIDVALQLTVDTLVSGKPVLESTLENTLYFILINFRDRNGNEFSYHTIKTLLDAKRTDKRLHPDSPKRIDVGKNIIKIK